jgi:ankyrin repeat protein
MEIEDSRTFATDEDGGLILKLALDSSGRSALDIASDPQSTPSSFQVAVEHEKTHLATGHDCYTTWSLFRAAKHGNLTAVQRLIEAGADLQPKPGLFERESSAIKEAAKRQHGKVVEYLLEAGRLKIVHDGFADEKLQEAVRAGQHEEVERLVAAKKFLERAQSNNNQALREAAGNGDLALVKLLFAGGATPDGVGDDYPYTTALERAAEKGHTATIRFLLSKGAALAKHNSDSTALKHAAHGGYLEIVEDLLRAGADPNADNALHAAAFGGHLAVVDRLLDAGAGLDTSNGYENRYKPGHLTALQEAARGGHIAVVERLLGLGADVDALPRDSGYTALQGAAQSGSVDVVQCLLAAGAYVNEPNEGYRRTSLEAAAEAGHLEIVNVLLGAGAVIEKPTHSNATHAPALNVAIEKGYLKVADRLLQHMTGTGDEELPERTRKALVPALHAAASGGHDELVMRLLAIGVPTDDRDMYQHLVGGAVSKGHTSTVRILLDAGAAIEGPKASTWQSNLQSAICNDHLGTARLLIEREADVNAAPARLKPPLHLACAKGNLDLVQVLLDAGADVYAKSYTGETVQQCAIEGGNTLVLHLITSAESNTTPPPSTDHLIALSTIPKRTLCPPCLALPWQLFDTLTPHAPSYREFKRWHPSLTSLRNSVRNGCPFCMFFWKQLGIDCVTIPQPSPVPLCQGGSAYNRDSIWSQVDEPFPEDVEEPERVRAGFHGCVAPFEGMWSSLLYDSDSLGELMQCR